MRTLVAKVHKFCFREKGHLIVASGYLATTFWHNTALMSAAYGVAALLTTHAIHRTSTQANSTAGIKHTPKHRVVA